MEHIPRDGLGTRVWRVHHGSGRFQGALERHVPGHAAQHSKRTSMYVLLANADRREQLLDSALGAPSA